MNRSSWVRSGILAALLAIPLACTNNSFNPGAQLVVTSVLPPTTTTTSVAFINVIGIALDQTTTPPSFLYADPQITIQNGSKLPEAYLDTAMITVTLGQIQLPTKQFPVTIVVPKGGLFTGSVPFLRGDPDVRNAVFPNGTPNKGAEGKASVTLMGKDKNGNEVSTAFVTPLSFVTVTLGASASPGASPGPVVPTASPSAVPSATPTIAPPAAPSAPAGG